MSDTPEQRPEDVVEEALCLLLDVPDSAETHEAALNGSAALARLVAERDEALSVVAASHTLATRLASLPLPVSADERREWYEAQQRLRDALDGVPAATAAQSAETADMRGGEQP